jgi:hypothetical protein
MVQQTPAKPGVVGFPPLDIPFVGHVELPGRILEGVGVGVGIAGRPLIPAFPISVEPSGIPARLAPPGEIVEGDDELAPLLPPLEAQGEAPFPIAAVPAKPPMPVVPPVAVLLPIPAMPPPSKVPVEFDTLDVADVALPATEQGMVLPVVEPNDEAPLGAGLTPVVPSSVAPIGMPAGAADRLPPRPSGEVGSTLGDETDGICANAALLPRRAATIATMNKCLTCPPAAKRFADADRQTFKLDASVRRRPGRIAGQPADLRSNIASLGPRTRRGSPELNAVPMPPT